MRRFPLFVILILLATGLFASTAAGALYETNTECLSCHDVLTGSGAMSLVDFRAPIEYSKCKACHVASPGDYVHGKASRGLHCRDCHPGNTNARAAWSGQWEDPVAGRFASALSLSTPAPTLHGIHLTADWMSNYDSFDYGTDTRYCKNCHLVAGCDSCHAAPPQHASHVGVQPSSVASFAAVSSYVGRGAVTGSMAGITSTFNYGSEQITCYASACHPKTNLTTGTNTRPNCGSCHPTNTEFHGYIPEIHQSSWTLDNCGGSGCHTTRDLMDAHVERRSDFACSDCHGSVRTEVLAAIADGITGCGDCHLGVDETSGHRDAHWADPLLVGADGSNYSYYTGSLGDGPTEECVSCHVSNLIDEHTGVAGEREPRRGTDGSALTCATCHGADADISVQLALATGQTRCDACHFVHGPIDEMHGSDYVETPPVDCAACHSSNLVNEHAELTAEPLAGETLTGCDVCHSYFGSPLGPDVQSAIDSGDTRCGACHAPEHPDLGGHTATAAASLECGVCHAAGETTIDIRAVHSDSDVGPCAVCHGNPDRVADVTSASAECAECHAAAGVDYHRNMSTGHIPAQNAAVCGRCHGGALDAIHVEAEDATGNAACFVCHGSIAPLSNDCTTNCHFPFDSSHVTPEHVSSWDLGNCSDAGCHGSRDLIVVHDEHRTVLEGPFTCVMCHDSDAPAVQSAITGKQTGCDACHAGYTPDSAHRTAHWAEPPLTDASGPRYSYYLGSAGTQPTRDCAGCHRSNLADEHLGRIDSGYFDPEPRLDRSGQPLTCATCHGSEDQMVRGAIAVGLTNCDACHTVHGPIRAIHTGTFIDQPQVECAGCHVADISVQHNGTYTVITPGGESLTGCDVCHSYYEVPRGPEVQTAIAAKDVRCTACHASEHPDLGSHTATSTMSLECGGCHATGMNAIDVKAVHVDASGGPCAVCHSGTSRITPISDKTAECTRCHSTEGADYHRGLPAKHTYTDMPQTCTGSNCHSQNVLPDAHEPYLTRYPDYATTCALCHDNASPGRIPADATAACDSCHFPIHQNMDHAAGDSQECVDCHLTTDALALHQNATAGPCDVCHANPLRIPVLPETLKCVNCHEYSPVQTGHYPVENHTALMMARTVSAGGTASASCQTCHSAALSAAHIGPTTNYGTGLTCAECHNDEYSNGRAQVTTDWPARVCESCHSSGSAIMHSETMAPPVIATSSESCGSSGIGCHQTADIHSLHANRGCALIGCHDVRDVVPTMKSCGSGDACHTGYDATYHGENLPHTAGTTQANTMLGEFACGRCHGMDLVSQHAAQGCAGCHSAYPEIVSGDWAARDTDAACAACHGPAHSDLSGVHAGAAVQTPVSGDGGKDCATCHRIDLIADHTGCATCHDSAYFPGALWMGDCSTVCHTTGNAGVPHDGHSAAHDFSVTSPACASSGCHAVSDAAVTHEGSSGPSCTACHSVAAVTTARGCYDTQSCHGTDEDYHDADHASTSTCVGCHIAYQDIVTGHVGACASCHQNTILGTVKSSTYSTACTDCHNATTGLSTRDYDPYDPEHYDVQPHSATSQAGEVSGFACSHCHGVEMRGEHTKPSSTFELQGYADVCVACHRTAVDTLTGAWDRTCDSCHTARHTGYSSAHDASSIAPGCSGGPGEPGVPYLTVLHSEGFDDVTAPAWPSTWSKGGADPGLLMTAGDAVQSAPNAARFAGDGVGLRAAYFERAFDTSALDDPRITFRYRTSYPAGTVNSGTGNLFADGVSVDSANWVATTGTKVAAVALEGGVTLDNGVANSTAEVRFSVADGQSDWQISAVRWYVSARESNTGNSRKGLTVTSYSGSQSTQLRSGNLSNSLTWYSGTVPAPSGGWTSSALADLQVGLRPTTARNNTTPVQVDAVRFEVDWVKDAAPSTSSFTAAYSADGGTSWTTLVHADETTPWTALESAALPVGANVLVRYTFGSDAPDRIAWVDDIEITHMHPGEPAAGSTCHAVGDVAAVHESADDRCAVCHVDATAVPATLDCASAGCHATGADHDGLHLVTDSSDYADGAGEGSESGCTNSGAGCHGTTALPTNGAKVFHPNSGCLSGACHSSESMTASWKSSGEGVECARCHDGSFAGAPDAIELFDASPDGHYTVLLHTATQGLGTVSAGGIAAANCSACHDLDMRTAHRGPDFDSQTKGTSVTCGECHGYNSATTNVIATDWMTRRCDACHASGVLGAAQAMHGASAPVVTGSSAAGCGSSGSGCHTSYDLHALHRDAAGGCALTGCHDAKNKDMTGAARSCGQSDGCHAAVTLQSHYTQTAHTATGDIAGTFSGVACSTCHSTHLRPAHASTSAYDCLACHNAVVSASIIGAWSRDCSACHAIKHDAYESGHVGVPPAGNTCVGQGCHRNNSTDLAVVHSSSALGCALAGCHDGSNKDRSPMIKQCAQCHSDKTDEHGDHSFSTASDFSQTTQRGCTNSGSGCHGGDTVYDARAYHEGCIGCHGSASYAGYAAGSFDCVHCHDGDYAGAADVIELTGSTPDGHYGEAIHAASQMTRELGSGGSAKAACSVCHDASLYPAHGSMSASYYGSSLSCWQCHNDTRSNGNQQVLANWTNDSCDDCHTIGSKVMHSKTTAPAVTGSTTAGCTTGTGCHSTELHALHRDATSCAVAGCHDVKNVKPTKKSCGTGGACHATASGDHQAEHDTLGQVDSGCYGCHFRYLTGEHSALGLSCGTCHASTNSVVKAAIAAKDRRCLTCHPNSAHNTRQNSEFAPGNASMHRVNSGLPGMRSSFLVNGTTYTMSLPSASSFLRSGYGYDTVVKCDSCHTYSGSTGPHGAAMKVNIDPAYPNPYKVVTGSESFTAQLSRNSPTGMSMTKGGSSAAKIICEKCHVLKTSSGSWSNVAHAEHDDRGREGSFCNQCHVAIPHGWGRPRLIGYTTDPAAYRTWVGTSGSRDGGLARISLKSYTPSNWAKSDCGAGCSSSRHPFSGTTWPNQMAAPADPNMGSVSGKVTDQSGVAVSAATVTIGSATATTGSDGMFAVTNLAAGTHSVTVAKSGYTTWAGTVSVTSGASTTLNVQLQTANVATNLARTGTATASSSYSSGNGPSAAIDGSTTSYWRSGSSGTQWLRVDLGSSKSVSKVVVNWNGSYHAKAYRVETSTDGTNWTSRYSTSSGTSGTKTHTFSAVSARYIRLYCTSANSTNYRVNEFETWNF